MNPSEQDIERSQLPRKYQSAPTNPSFWPLVTESINAGDGLEPDIKPVAEDGDGGFSLRGLLGKLPFVSRRLKGLLAMYVEPAEDKKGI